MRWRQSPLCSFSVHRCCWIRHAQTPFPEPSRSIVGFSRHIDGIVSSKLAENHFQTSSRRHKVVSKWCFLCEIKTEIWSNYSVFFAEVKHINKINRTIWMDIIIVMVMNKNEINLWFSWSWCDGYTRMWPIDPAAARSLCSNLIYLGPILLIADLPDRYVLCRRISRLKALIVLREIQDWHALPNSKEILVNACTVSKWLRCKSKQMHTVFWYIFYGIYIKT